MHYNFNEIISNFDLKGEFEYAEEYGLGHINDTYAIYFKNGTYRRYILQRINTNVFKKPKELMFNVSCIIDFIKNKIVLNGGDPLRETLNIVKTKDEKPYFLDSDKNYWRIYLFIEYGYTYQLVENPVHLYNSGKAFGNFQKLLNDYPVEFLFYTIPDFHNTKKRFEKLVESIARDKCDRVKNVLEEINFALNMKDDAEVLVNMLEEKKLPLRVTHNDTKFNNVMIDALTDNAICVIDLDTVMPGLSLYDYGDSIRSGATTAEEDETDLDKVSLDMNLFENFTKGYLEETKDFLTKEEISMLVFSAKLITYECGIRFLTDYLEGDIYFKIHKDGHNLDRAKNQFKMVKEIEEKKIEMELIIQKILNI